MDNKIKAIILKWIYSLAVLILIGFLGRMICSFYNTGILVDVDDEKSFGFQKENGHSIEISEEELELVSLEAEFVKLEKSDIGKKIDINTALPEILILIDGISLTKAEAIVRMRYEIGGFECIEDLRNVEGISDKTYNKIKNKVYASDNFDAAKDAKIIKLLDKEKKIEDFEKAWNELTE